ncbi:MAG: hypothetical protein ACREXP_20895 [Steroidobacteraceae bacterium]
MALYAPDTITFDLMPPHQVPDADHYRKNFERWFAAMPGPLDYENGILEFWVHVIEERADRASR